MESIMKFKKVLKGEFIAKIIESFFGRASFVIFTMFFSLVCTRWYGAEIFGQYTYVFSIVTLLSIFAKVGFDNSLIYTIPQDGNKQISFSFVVNAIVSIVIIIISFFIVKDPNVKMMLPLVWFVSMEQIFFGIYRANDRIKGYFFINGFVAILLRILLIVLFYYVFNKSLFSISLGLYMSYIFSNIVYFLQNKDRFKKVIVDKKYLIYSLSLVLAAVMGVAMDRVDIIMLGSLSDMKSVGIYQIAVQVANAIFMILVIFDTVFAPQISKLYHSGKLDELRNMYVRFTRILGLIALISVLFVIVFSNYILLFFGKEFIEGQIPLILRCLGQLVNVAVGSVWLMLAMTGRPKFQIYSNLIAFIINIVLNFLLIPKYGATGAAIATMTSMILINIIGYVLVCRVFKLKVYRVI